MKKILAAIALGLCMFASNASAIDINTATAEELDASPLMRMSKMTAMKTVAERDKNGPFKDGADLMARVPGIGKTFLETNKTELQFGTGAATTTPAAAPATAPVATPAVVAPAPAAAAVTPAPAAPAAQ